MISSASAYTARLTALARLANRPVIRTRVILSPHVELSGTQWALMRESWTQHFGSPNKGASK